MKKGIGITIVKDLPSPDKLMKGIGKASDEDPMSDNQDEEETDDGSQDEIDSGKGLGEAMVDFSKDPSDENAQKIYDAFETIKHVCDLHEEDNEEE